MSQLEQDLAFVRSVVEDSRKALQVDAWPLLFWGLLSLAGVILTYLWPPLDSIWLWVLLIGLAWILTGWRALRYRSGAVGSLAGRALASLWFGLLTSMTLIGFVGGFSETLPPAILPPIVAAVFGAGYLATAALLDRRVVAVLAFAWWAGAVGLFLTPGPIRLAIFGGLLLVLLVLPVARLVQTLKS
jgi:hypothetical protein